MQTVKVGDMVIIQSIIGNDLRNFEAEVINIHDFDGIEVVEFNALRGRFAGVGSNYICGHRVIGKRETQQNQEDENFTDNAPEYC